MEQFRKMTFEEDLLSVASRVSDALNIFNEIASTENKLVVRYGKDEFIALILTPYEARPNWAHLRLRTKEMAAGWDNVPAGFSQINESRGLLNDMKQAAKVSLKRNSLWYIDYQIKETIGEQIVFTETKSKKGYAYKAEFLNGYTVHICIEKNDKEYYKSHDEAKLYYLADSKNMPISAPMTADECIMMLINIGMQTDLRMTQFIATAEQVCGRTTISSMYRVDDECYDEVKAVFANNYAMKVSIKNNKIHAEIIGIDKNDIVVVDTRDFTKIDDVCLATENLAKLEKFEK